MNKRTRRELFQDAGRGLAVTGLAGGVLVLRADAAPTPGTVLSSDVTEEVRSHLKAAENLPSLKAAEPLTKDIGPGPFYSPGAPFRAKICPPFEPGQPLVVSGRVWGYDTKHPLAGALLDVWHSDIKGHYSEGSDFRNRARLLANESGYYEFETIRPVGYPVNNGEWYRAAHIHWQISHPGYKTIATELLFEGDPLQKQDKVFQPTLVRPVEKRKREGKTYQFMVFDIVLAPDEGKKAVDLRDIL